MESNSISEADRCTTVSWLMEVVAACGLQPATLFLAVSYLDRFLAASKVRRGVVRVQGSTLLVQAKVSDLCCYSSLASRQALHIKDVQSYLLDPPPHSRTRVSRLASFSSSPRQASHSRPSRRR